MNINWADLKDASDDNERSADIIICTDGGLERRATFNGGWVQLMDSQHTEGSPQAITANTLTHYTVDGLGVGTETDYRRGVSLDVFGDSIVQPFARGEAYNINLSFSVAKSSSNAAFVEIDVGIGADYATIINRDRRSLTKGSGVTDFLFFGGTLPVTDAVSRYGAKLFLLFSEDVTLWNKTIMLQRTHSP